MGKLLEKVALLDDAHDLLTKELDRAHAEWKRNGRYDVGDLLNRIDGIAIRLSQIDGGADELHRRAGLVENMSGAGSEYDQARAEVAVTGHGCDRQRKTFDAMKAAMAQRTPSERLWHKLLSGNPVPLLASEVEDQRKMADVLAGAMLATGQAVDRPRQQALHRLGVACATVSDTAKNVAADGCFLIYHVHAANTCGPSERARLVRAMLLDENAGPMLWDDIAAATGKLAGWVHAQAEGVLPQPPGADDPEWESPVKADTPKRRKKRGRKKSGMLEMTRKRYQKWDDMARNGMSHEEIASECGAERGTISSGIKRLRDEDPHR